MLELVHRFAYKLFQKKYKYISVQYQEKISAEVKNRKK